MDFLTADGTKEELDFLLILAESDPVPYLRYQVIEKMARKPPFSMGQGHKLDSEELVERIWGLMKYVEYFLSILIYLCYRTILRKSKSNYEYQDQCGKEDHLILKSLLSKLSKTCYFIL